jgi:hypothetical protein
VPNSIPYRLDRICSLGKHRLSSLQSYEHVRPRTAPLTPIICSRDVIGTFQTESRATVLGSLALVLATLRGEERQAQLYC